jgi:hypothetical protein
VRRGGRRVLGRLAHVPSHGRVDAFAEGRNVVQVQRWLGHHAPSFTLDTYIHLLEVTSANLWWLLLRSWALRLPLSRRSRLSYSLDRQVETGVALTGFLLAVHLVDLRRHEELAEVFADERDAHDLVGGGAREVRHGRNRIGGNAGATSAPLVGVRPDGTDVAFTALLSERA